MLQLTLTTGNTQDKADMFIDYQSEEVNFTVLTKEDKQYDFHIEREKWKAFKDFIETSMREDEGVTGSDTENLIAKLIPGTKVMYQDKRGISLAEVKENNAKYNTILFKSSDGTWDVDYKNIPKVVKAIINE